VQIDKGPLQGHEAGTATEQKRAVDIDEIDEH